MLLPPGLPSIKNIRKRAKPTSVDRTVSFHLPSELNADRPPERRGLTRDRVRLLVLDRNTGRVTHTRFDRITELLSPGVLRVFNSSRTLPATLTGRLGHSTSTVEVRLAELMPDGLCSALRHGGSFGGVAARWHLACPAAHSAGAAAWERCADKGIEIRFRSRAQL